MSYHTGTGHVYRGAPVRDRVLTVGNEFSAELESPLGAVVRAAVMIDVASSSVGVGAAVWAREVAVGVGGTAGRDVSGGVTAAGTRRGRV